MKLAIEDKRDTNISSMVKRHRTLEELRIWVSDYSSMLCASYLLTCEFCGSIDHINYKCKCNIDTMLASYNSGDKCNASMELLEFVLFTGSLEVLTRIRDIEEESKALDKIYGVVQPIYCLCQDNFRDNALVITCHERISAAMKVPNLLQDSREEEEEDVHRSEPVFDVYSQVIDCAIKFNRSYQISCNTCKAVGHFTFNCTHTLKEFHVSYTKAELFEYFVYRGAHDLLAKTIEYMVSSDSEFLQENIKWLPPVIAYSEKHLSENPLVLESKARSKSVVPEDNHL